MAKKKTKKNTTNKPAPAEAEAAVVEDAVEAPAKEEEAAASESVTGSDGKEFPAFKGGGYNDFLNWKGSKANWEAEQNG